MPTIAPGMLATDGDYIERVGKMGEGKIFLQGVKWLACLAVLITCPFVEVVGSFKALMNAMSVFAIIILSKELIGKIPVLRNVLQLFGKYSFGIVMTHSLFIIYFFDG